MESIRFKMIYKNINKNDNKEKLENYEENKLVKLNILGSEFVKNNKNKAKLIINNKKHNLQEFLKIKNIPNSNIKIGMIFTKDLCKASFIFENCNSLINLSFHDNIEIINEDNLDRLNEFEEKEKSMEYDFDSDAKELDVYKNYKTDTYTIYTTISKNEITIKGKLNNIFLE